MRHATSIGALIVLLLAGCGDRESVAGRDAAAVETAPAAELTPEQLGELGAEIESSPAEAEQILSARGMTLPQFEQAIRKVSSDPDLSKRYAAAFRKAKA